MHSASQVRKCGWPGILPVIVCFAPFVILRAIEASDPSQPDPAAFAVVQLLAIGPGEIEKNRECSATGFMVNEDGDIVTNAHVYEQAQHCLAGSLGARILAKFAGPGSGAATAVSCELVGLDGPHDLAVMKTERPLRTVLRGVQPAFLSLNPATVAVGTPVRVTGHPGFAWQPVTQSGRVVRNAILRLSDESRDSTEVIVVDIPLKLGNSGSPVYLEAGGGVVGIVERRDALRPSETVAVPTRYAIELLNLHGVRWHRSK